MKTEFEYIHFKQVVGNSKKKKTSTWACRSNRGGGDLGTVSWYSPWRQYCFSPVSGAGVVTIFSKGCLHDIESFLQELMEERMSTTARTKGGKE